MFVDYTGEEVTSFCVDGGVGGKYRSDVASDENLFDAIVFDDDATELTAPSLTRMAFLISVLLCIRS